MKTTVLLFCILLLGSCAVMRQPPKTAFTDGFYKQQKEDQKQIVYVQTGDDELKVYRSKKEAEKRLIDHHAPVETLPKELTEATYGSHSFTKTTFDIDFLTIPLKCRPGLVNVPSQLNSNLNGAAYVGYRTDKYKVSYKANPFGKANRELNHFAVSFGVFTGIGNTFMSPTNTNNILQQEYDGIVWSKGVAGIFAVNRFTVGLSFGFDNVLDKNRKIWLYESKPWLGLVFGLNLN